MSIVVWAMMGIAFWHFAVLVPDRFWGGIVGTFLAALGGVLLSGFALPARGIPDANPPGTGEVLWVIPGSVYALAASYFYGARKDRAQGSSGIDVNRPAVLSAAAAGQGRRLLAVLDASRSSGG